MEKPWIIFVLLLIIIVWTDYYGKGVRKMEKKKRVIPGERSRLKKAQEVTYQSDFKAADRAAQQRN